MKWTWVKLVLSAMKRLLVLLISADYIFHWFHSDYLENHIPLKGSIFIKNRHIYPRKIKNEMIFLSYLWINVGNINSEIRLKNINSEIRLKKKNHFISRMRDYLKFTSCQVPHLMIVLIPYINLINLSWIIKCLFLRNMEPLSRCQWAYAASQTSMQCMKRLSHYKNTPIQIYWKFHLQKTEKFLVKSSDFFSYFCSKHRLWVLVRTASARRGGSNAYPQSMF